VLDRAEYATEYIKEKIGEKGGVLELAPPRPNQIEQPYTRMMAGSIGEDCGPKEPSGLTKKYLVTDKAYYGTVARAPVTYTTEKTQGREKPVMPDCSWHKGCDGQLSLQKAENVKKQLTKKQNAINMKKNTGRESNVGLPAPIEKTPETDYKAVEAWKKQAAVRIPDGDDWSVLPDRDEQGDKA